jgi:ABC 3 transport family.
LVAGLTALPAASARNLSKKLKTFRFLSFLFGILCAIFGISLFQFTGYPAGPLIVLSGFLIFLISIIFKK